MGSIRNIWDTICLSLRKILPIPKETDEVWLHRTLTAALKELLRRVNEGVPDMYMFKPVGMRFFLRDQTKLGTLAVEYDEKEHKTKRRLWVGVSPAGSDRCAKQYFPAMTTQEIKELLAGPGTVDQVQQAIAELSAAIDRDS